MATSHYARVVNEDKLEGGQLLLFGEDPKTFGISCTVDGSPFLIAFSDDGQKRGPLLVPPMEGRPIVSYGHEFIVGFEPYGCQIGARPSVGDLMIDSQGPSLVFNAQHGLGYVNLYSGEAANLARHANFGLIREWSISIDTWCDEHRRVVVFERSNA